MLTSYSEEMGTAWGPLKKKLDEGRVHHLIPDGSFYLTILSSLEGEKTKYGGIEA